MKPHNTQQLQSAVLKTMSADEKIDSCEKESKELLEMVPGYAKAYLKKKFSQNTDGNEKNNTENT